MLLLLESNPISLFFTTISTSSSSLSPTFFILTSRLNSSSCNPQDKLEGLKAASVITILCLSLSTLTVFISLVVCLAPLSSSPSTVITTSYSSSSTCSSVKSNSIVSSCSSLLS